LQKIYVAQKTEFRGAQTMDFKITPVGLHGHPQAYDLYHP
jgi:hypothetical protein